MKVITAVFGNQKLFEKDDEDSLIAIKVDDVVYFYETLHGGKA